VHTNLGDNGVGGPIEHGQGGIQRGVGPDIRRCQTAAPRSVGLRERGGRQQEGGNDGEPSDPWARVSEQHRLYLD
jgi:hypothetical protein